MHYQKVKLDGGGDGVSVPIEAGQQGYRNGSADDGAIGTDAVAYHTVMAIGAKIRSDAGAIDFWDGSIQALAFYDTELSAAQMLAVSQAMAAL